MSPLAYLDASFVETVALLVPVHQGIIDLLKLFGMRSRQYWEALAYVVYGPSWAGTAKRHTPWGEAPMTLDKERRAQWKSGPQIRLIESFLLRAVGDSPATELSDADVTNAARIARSEAGHAGDVGTVLEELVRNVPRTTRELRELLGQLKESRPASAIDAEIDSWLACITEDGEVNPAQLLIWRNRFNRNFLPGVVRAEIELPNALKSAEYRYAWYMRTASAILAAIEGAVLASYFAPKPGTDGADSWALPVLWFAATGALLVFPVGTKSLTDAIVGIGRKLRR